MATIITPGRTPEPNKPWYLRDKLTCPECGCVFRLDDADMEGTDGIRGDGSPWEIIATSRPPGSAQLIEGPCPGCTATIILRGRNSESL
jgi:predicted RNA-binding Zn-ribbon protein involved in translation (DUF1610 family)